MVDLKIGYKASPEQFGPRRLVELGVAAEQHGFDTVTVSDHYQPWRHEGGHAPFSLAWMSAVGERTERVLLGTSVLTPTFRYHPAVIAQAFATMGCLFPGRVMLGIGTGLMRFGYADVFDYASERLGIKGSTAQKMVRFAERLRERPVLRAAVWLGDITVSQAEAILPHCFSVKPVWGYRPNRPISFRVYLPFTAQ